MTKFSTLILEKIINYSIKNTNIILLFITLEYLTMFFETLTSVNDYFYIDLPNNNLSSLFNVAYISPHFILKTIILNKQNPNYLDSNVDKIFYCLFIFIILSFIFIAQTYFLIIKKTKKLESIRDNNKYTKIFDTLFVNFIDLFFHFLGSSVYLILFTE